MCHYTRLSKMLADKIYAISGQNVCRRVKDVLDIYVMSFITKVNADELYEIWKETENWGILAHIKHRWQN